MPQRPARVCLHQGCGRAAIHGYCHVHKPRECRGNAAARGYDARWRALSIERLKANPLCVSCGGVATLTDHIIPRDEGGDDAEENLQSLCGACHRTKTLRDKMKKCQEAPQLQTMRWENRG